MMINLAFVGENNWSTHQQFKSNLADSEDKGKRKAVKRRRAREWEVGAKGSLTCTKSLLFRIPRENARNAGKHRRANVARSLCER